MVGVYGWRGGGVPSVRPESLCESFRAGNLKKMKMYMEPSKMLAVTPRTRRRLSEPVSCVLESRERCNLPSMNRRRGFLGAVAFPSTSRIELWSFLSPKFSDYFVIRRIKLKPKRECLTH